MAEGRRAGLRDVRRTMAGAVARTLDALAPPESDTAVAELARQLAEAVDTMPPALRPTMLPQASGQLLKVLAELDARARRRATPAGRAPSKLDDLRAARARQDAGRQRG